MASIVCYLTHCYDPNEYIVAAYQHCQNCGLLANISRKKERVREEIIEDN